MIADVAQERRYAAQQRRQDVRPRIERSRKLRARSRVGDGGPDRPPGAGGPAWLLVGITLLLVGAVWLVSLTYTIVGPLIAATVIAAVAAPVVAWLQRHRIPRGVGAALILLALIALAVLVAVVVMAGIASESAALSGHLTEAKTHHEDGSRPS